MDPSGAAAPRPLQRFARPLSFALIGGWVLVVGLAAWQVQRDRAAPVGDDAAVPPPAAPDGLRRGAGP